MVRHVTAAGGDVGRLRHAVEEDLLGGEAGRDAGREVAVVGEELVPSGPEGHPERELDRVMPRRRRVVAPAETLLQVVRRLVVENPRQVHQRVPLLDLFARDAREPLLSPDAPRCPGSRSTVLLCSAFEREPAFYQTSCQPARIAPDFRSLLLS